MICESKEMRKQIQDILKEEITKTIINHVKYHMQHIPTVSELDDIINYYYSDDVQEYILKYGMYKYLLTLNYQIEA